MRTGSYPGFTVGKGLTILGDGSVQLLPPQPTLLFSTYGVDVNNLEAGQALVLAGFSIRIGNDKGGVSISNAAGRVHLQDISTTGSPSGGSAAEALDVVDSACVTAAECNLRGQPGVRALRSDVTLVGSAAVGLNGSSGLGGSIFSPGAGLDATSATVHVSRCTVSGGNGIESAFPGVFRPDSSGARLTSSTVYWTGLASDTVRAGGSIGPTTAILVNSGTLHLDPGVDVQGSLGAPATSGAGTVLTREIVSLDAGGGQLGGTLSLAVGSPAGDAFALFGGAPVTPVQTVFGAVYVDLVTAIPLLFGAVQPGGELTSLTLNVPANPVFQGVALGFQAANFYQGTGAIEMSNVGVVVIR